MTDTVYYERNQSRTLHGGHVVDVHAKLYSLGEQTPYFSITADEWASSKRTERGWISGGCNHELIARVFPHMQPIVDVHLSTADGAPMHAVGNAFHWLGFSTWDQAGHRPMSPKDEYGRIPVVTDAEGREWSPELTVNHLRCTYAEACDLHDELARLRLAHWEARTGFPKRDLRADLERLLAEIDMPARWQADADRALALMTGLRPLPVVVDGRNTEV